MSLPFTASEFFAVFASYNTRVWPSQLALLALALIAVAAALRRRGRLVLGILALLWLWMATVYHLAFFASINPAARLFAVVFAMQSTLLLRLALRHCALRTPTRSRRIAGLIFVTYALIGYPLVAYLAGQRFPALPTFGLPCPTTIFTLGMLLLVPVAIPRWIFIIPLAWALVATSAALQLQVVEDFGLTLAAIATLPFLLAPTRSSSTSLASGRSRFAA